MKKLDQCFFQMQFRCILPRGHEGEHSGEYAKLKADNNALREMLARNQWQISGARYSHCLECKHHYPAHLVDCPLAALLETSA